MWRLRRFFYLLAFLFKAFSFSRKSIQLVH